MENFADPCEDVITWLDDMISHNTGFAEGWGLYAENPLLPIDLNLYKDNKMELFGMVKWQVSDISFLSAFGEHLTFEKMSGVLFLVLFCYFL